MIDTAGQSELNSLEAGGEQMSYYCDSVFVFETKSAKFMVISSLILESPKYTSEDGEVEHLTKTDTFISSLEMKRRLASEVDCRTRLDLPPSTFDVQAFY